MLIFCTDLVSWKVFMLAGFCVFWNTFISFFFFFYFLALIFWHNSLFPSLSLVSVISPISPSFLWSRILFRNKALQVTVFFTMLSEFNVYEDQGEGKKWRKVWKANQHSCSVKTVSAITLAESLFLLLSLGVSWLWS